VSDPGHDAASWPADSRRRGREAALQVLYQAEIGKHPLEVVRGMVWQVGRPEQDVPSERMRAFAMRLAEGTLDALGRIDPLLEAHAQNWRLARMAVVDRLILRLAVYEFLETPETPRRVVIDEALELAKRYSAPDAVKFINGVLDAVRRRLDADAPGGTGTT
jgi:transcription antitermination protein NusB